MTQGTKTVIGIICIVYMAVLAHGLGADLTTQAQAAPHDLPRINPMDIPYTPCGQQLVETNMVTIGNAKCVQLIYADGSMNHLCDKPPQT